MILDTLSHSPLYQPLSPRVAAGLKWLESFSPATAEGRYDIAGDDVFALVQRYDTVPAAEKKYESHRVYADIQYVVNGAELVYHAPISCLRPLSAYDEKKDSIHYADSAAVTPLLLEPGRFAIFHAQDGHKPGCVYRTVQRIEKVVIKVRL